MTKRFFKHKILLDENVYYRASFPKLNNLFDVKHITQDYHEAGLDDAKVYQYAIQTGRIIVTFNIKDFREIAKASNKTGVVGIYSHQPAKEIDKKLIALFRKATEKSLLGKLTTISGEPDA